MEEFVDYYELIKVDPQADTATIEQAIRGVRKRYRNLEGSPDLTQRSAAERMMVMLSEAEKVLLNSYMRSEYDAKRASEIERRENEKKQADKDWLADAEEYMSSKQYGSALFAAEEATRQQPGNPWAWATRGFAAFYLDKYDEAEYSARESLKIDGSYLPGITLLAEVCIQTENYDEALLLSEHGLHLDPTAFDFADNKVRVFLLTDRYSDALKAARENVEKFPENDHAKFLLGTCLRYDAEEAMSKQAGMVFLTNERQIEYVGRAVEELRALKPDDEELVKWEKEISGLLEEAKTRRYVGAPTWYWVVAVLTVILVFAGALINPIVWVMIAVLVVFGVNNVWPVGWRANALSLGSAATSTGLQ